MAFIIKDRVKENTTSTGTGVVSLGGAAATFDTFQSFMTNGDTTYYAIAHTTSGTDEWEVGLGTWNTGNTLTRTTVLAGSNGTSAVTFSSGSKDIFMTYPAAHAALAGDDVSFANITVTGTVDGRDVAADGTKLDTVETNADLTDAVNVAAAGALMRSGGTMTSNLILNADPAAALGAATKQYVDTIASAGIHYHSPVRAEHPSNLNATYSNGSAGVGATLTNAGTNAALVLDSVSMVVSDRVLVANQTNQTQNGVYTVTTVGDGSTAWVLTRSTDTDTSAPSDPDAFGKGDAFFIKEGSTNAGHLDVLSTAGTITFGTTNIVFSEVAETTVYSGGTGVTLTGTTFSVGQDVATSSSVTFNQVTAAIIGNVTGNLTGDVTGNADTATTLETARTVQLSGDVTGSATFDGSVDINITASVQDDSHAHVISNVDGLQTALDAKTPTSRIVTAGNGLTGGGDLTANRTFTVGSGTGVTVNANDIAIGQDVATTATPTFAGLTTTGDLNFGDNDKAIFGAGSDLQIYHDGSNSYIRDAGVGNLYVRSNVFRVYNASGTEISANFVQNGAVTLYYDNAAKIATTSTGVDVTGNITATGTIDGRDVAADGTKLDGVEANADVTDTTNVTSAGALMDSEVTNLAQVKAFDSSDYATAAQGALADSAVQPNDNPTFGTVTAGGLGIGTATLNSNKVVIEGGAAGTNSSTLKLSTGDSANGLVSDLAFYGTFVTPTTDKGPRRTADITSGFSTGNWGNEYLAFGVGGASDSVYATTERMRINSTGVDVTGNITATGTIAPAGGVVLSGWTITESGGVLYFATGGVNKMKIDASGNITTVGNITAFGTI